MKKAFVLSFLALTYLFITAFSDDDSEKIKKIYVSKELNVSANKAWQIIAVEYDKVQNSHPKIISSQYVGNYSEFKEGAQRRVNFNEEGSKYMVEEIASINLKEMTILFNTLEVEEIPIKAASTRSMFKIEDLGNDRSKVSCVMQYETSPSFLGGMVKRKLEKRLMDYLVAVEHYAKTGEKVTRTNFSRIKKAQKD